MVLNPGFKVLLSFSELVRSDKVSHSAKAFGLYAWGIVIFNQEIVCSREHYGLKYYPVFYHSINFPLNVSQYTFDHKQPHS